MGDMVDFVTDEGRDWSPGLCRIKLYNPLHILCWGRCRAHESNSLHLLFYLEYLCISTVLQNQSKIKTFVTRCLATTLERWSPAPLHCSLEVSTSPSRAVQRLCWVSTPGTFQTITTPRFIPRLV